VDDYRRFPFLDPDLPAVLLPEDWCGAAAHAAFVRAYEALRAPAFRCFDALAGAPPAAVDAPLDGNSGNLGAAPCPSVGAALF
jgi:DNA-binding transcriptional regulator PaaX